MKSWKELIEPHEDVLRGTFKQSEFAADLTQVVNNSASQEYQNAQKFYQRTFVTEGLRLLLTSVIERLAGLGGDPVVQLQTAFGGGKTHAMLAVYHLVTRNCPLAKLVGLEQILAQLKVNDLPQTKLAVIDGNALAPSEAHQRDHLTIKTLWGELAYQLLGKTGYQLVAQADRDGTSPGKQVLAELLERASPCIILCDELVAYLRQFANGKVYPGGTFASNLSFIQALTEALKNVPKAILLASLPESKVEVGGERGVEALEALEKYFGRVETVWKPVGAEEAFNIVKRRLFSTQTSNETTTQIDDVCKKISDYYRRYKDRFPIEIQQGYHQRLINCYPIHPEIFDRLYQDWSTLANFQRTRGVLQFLATAIHRLWHSDNRDPLIMVSSLAVSDPQLNAQIIRYLSSGWDAVIASEIDGQQAKATNIDSKEPRLGKVHAAKKVARTIFFGSAPFAERQRQGLSRDRILLGACVPPDNTSVYEDALKRLHDKLHYLVCDGNAYRFATKANLRREMETRKQNFINRNNLLFPQIKKVLTKQLKRSNFFDGVHIFCQASEIPDDQKLRLVVLEPAKDSSYSKNDRDNIDQLITSFVNNCGDDKLRQFRNRLLFVVADRSGLTRLNEACSNYLAWQSIVDEVQNEKLNLDTYQRKEAENASEQARNVFEQTIKDVYKIMVNPEEDGKLYCCHIDKYGNNLGEAIDKKIREEELVVTDWADSHLENVLLKWYAEDTDVNIRKFFADCASYLYLPRLKNLQVLQQAIEKGVVNGSFGYARAENGSYQGLLYGDLGYPITIDNDSVLVKKEIASAKVAQKKQHPPSSLPTESAVTQEKVKQRFYGAIDIQPQRAKIDLDKIVDEVVLHLVADNLTSVSITLEITAQRAEHGFDQQLQRILQENCQALDFKLAEFEEGDDEGST